MLGTQFEWNRAGGPWKGLGVGPGGEGPGRRTDLSYVAALGQRAGAGAVPLLLPHSSCMRVVGGGPMEALGLWLTESQTWAVWLPPAGMPQQLGVKFE